MRPSIAMRHALGLVLLGALACRPTTQAQAPTQTHAADEASPLRFAWPAGAHAIVTERVLKKGRNATLRYRIATEQDGETLLVYYQDFDFLELEGFDLADPDVAAKVEAIERQVAGAIPPYRIAADGTWIGCGDLEQMVDRLGGILPPESIATFRELMKSADVRALVDAKLRDVWQSWVEGWLGVALRPGEHVDGHAPITAGDTTVMLPFRIERLAGVDTIELRARTELSGDAARAMTGAVLGEFVASSKKLAEKGPAVVDAVARVEVRRVHLREATLDPRTSLPRRAKSHVTIIVTHDGVTDESIESHEWTFDWQPSAPRGSE